MPSVNPSEEIELICAVCELPINEKDETLTQTFSKISDPFCSKDCFRLFMEDPEKYRQFDEEGAE